MAGPSVMETLRWVMGAGRQKRSEVIDIKPAEAHNNPETGVKWFFEDFNPATRTQPPPPPSAPPPMSLMI